MTWAIVDGDDTEQNRFDDEKEAQNERDILKDLDPSIKLQKVGKPTPDAGDINVEFIEMSDDCCGGNEDSDSDKDDSLTVNGEGGAPYKLCPGCGNLSASCYRCPDQQCGIDLTNVKYYRGEMP
ncbi:hypothetical protein [Halocatena halophila]|uniref:hypothetical protein n=1 Tax=Halocatena halophila TaxID=2814576 RepID=UPI002ED339C6